MRIKVRFLLFFFAFFQLQFTQTVHASICTNAILTADWHQTLLDSSQTAIYSAADARHALTDEAELRAQGFHAIIVKNPSDGDLQDFIDAGYIYGPSWVGWMQKLKPLEELLRESGLQQAGQKASEYIRKLGHANKLGVHFNIQRVALDLESFNLFREKIYIPYVVQRASGTGKDNMGADFLSEKGKTKGELHRFEVLFIYDQASGELLAGSVLEKFPDKKTLLIKYTGVTTNTDHRKLNLSLHVHRQAYELAKSLGYHAISYGADPNFYGNELVAPGLAAYKLEMLFTPTFFSEVVPNQKPDFSERRLIKFLDHQHIGSPRMTFSFRNPFDVTAGLKVDIWGETPPMRFVGDLPVVRHPDIP